MWKFLLKSMIRFVLVCWLIAFCWVQSAESTNEFIKNLLTTTPSSRHISDFRKQKRTDSRADKPDMFPGFDLQVDTTTASPRKRRRQAYTKLIRLFLQNTKDRLDTIRDVIKDESELHFHLTRPPPPSPPSPSGDSQERNAEIRFSDEENRQFIDFAFDDSIDGPETVAKIENEGPENTAQTYLNSLFAAVGYSRITTTTTQNPIASDDDDETTTQGNIIARYLINPLLSAWNSTRARFNLNNGSSDNDDSNSRTSGNVNNTTDAQTTIFRVNFFDNRDNIKPKMHTNSVSDMNKKPNENRVDNFNYSLPLIQHIPNNVTNGDDRVASDVKKPRNTVGTSVEDAAAAFRNAFLKYSNYMQHPMEYAKFNTFNENVELTQDNSNEMKSDKLLDGSLFTGNLFDTNSSHIQVVRGKKLKANGSLNESTTIANNDDVDDVHGDTESNGKTFAENAGILILEMFGTVIGMTWRAVGEIPKYFITSSQNDEA